MSIRRIVSIEQTEWSLAPPRAWVRPRDIDWSWRPPELGAVACLLLDEQHHVATQSVYQRSVRMLLNLSAVQALSQVEIEFDPAAQRLRVHDVAVWRMESDGAWRRREPVQREAFLLRQREQQFEQQMLNGRVSLVALLEDVRVGDAIDLAWTLEPREPLPGLLFTAFHTFAWTVPVGSASVALHLDREHPVQWRLTTPEGQPAPTEDVQADCASWCFERPPVFQPESNVPGSHWAWPVLEVTAWQSWAEVARFICALWAEALSDDLPAIAAEAARLEEGRSTEEAIRAAVRFVQEDVRYLAIDFGHGAGMLPSGAGTVLRRRFGDCKDKSVLLSALLCALGVEARPVLVGTGWREAVARLLPSTACFNHAIVAFGFEGQRYFVDPTVVGQGGDLAHLVAPPYGVALEIDAATEALTELPALAPAEISLTETFTLDRRGKEGAVEQELRATAWFADDIRALLLRQGLPAFAKARAEVLQQHFPALAPDAESTALEDDADDNAICLSTRHGLPTWGRVDRKPPDFFVYGAHGLFLGVEAVDEREQRRLPWALRHPMTVHHRVVVRGKPVRKSKPEYFEVEGPGFLYSCQVRSRRREVSFDYRWETTAREIPADRWGEYCQSRSRALERAGATVATIAPTMAALFRRYAVAIGIVAGLAVAGYRNGERNRVIAEAGGVERAAGKVWDYVKHGDFSQAYELGREIRPHYGNNFDIQAIFAEAAIRTGHLGEAEDALAQARRLKPDDPLPKVLGALMLSVRGDLVQARSRLAQIAAEPGATDPVFLELARVTERIGDRVAARAAWETVLARQPAQPEALFSLAYLMWQGGERTQADTLINGAITAQPARSPVLEGALARYYLATARPRVGLAPAKRATELAPTDPLLARQYAMTLLNAGERSAAVGAAQSMTERFPRNPLAISALAITAATAGEDARAEAAFRSWLDLAGDDPDAHSGYGYFLHRIGRETEARKVLEEATRRFPGSGNLWLNYAVVLEALGESGTAANARSQAARLMTAEQKATLVR
ncbi:DUF3857 domain-containing protein [Methylococcus sp. EFPC2]|uniref:DUF3857 domain-containing protein n=1 Tax=Methylococcus sp. EFPC2 TaxID=2812648 RepID=UPI001967F7BC|nr:DUF3857 domain-containing protein [Methylococcus sp. EFPC2]QSA97306.1 DUF3857 domain-containing protein [Methylococcus sp. EFPC2]